MEQRAATTPCLYCQHENPPTALACRVCESPLTVSLAVTRPVPPEPAKTIAALLAGGDKEQAERLEARLLAGRGVLVKAISYNDARWCQEQATRLGVQLEIRRWRVVSSSRKVAPPSWTSRPATGAMVLVSLLLLLLVGAYLYSTITQPPSDAGIGWRSATIRPGRLAALEPTAPASERPTPPQAGIILSPDELSALIAKVQQAVVRITVPEGVGTGFFVGRNGLIVTNYHVVAKARRVSVLSGSQEADARIVRLAPAWDLALLQVDLKPLHVLELADGARTPLMTPVFTTGSAGGLDGSVRAGNIAYIGRTIDAVSLLEVDAAVTGGNSGGPLVDYSGRVIGIVNAFLTDSDRTSFAVLSNYLFDGRDALLRGNGPVYPLSEHFLKLQLQALADVGEKVLERRALSSSQAFVTEGRQLAVVVEGSPSGPVTRGEPVEAELWIRNKEGELLLERVIRAGTSNPVAAGVAPETSRPAVFFIEQLTPEEHEAMFRAKELKVEVRVPELRIRDILPLSL